MAKNKIKDVKPNIEKDYNENWEEIGIAKVHSDEIIDEEKIKPKIKPKPVSKISYTISGLPNAILKKEALKMLADGASVKEVAGKYGVAPSDISILS